MKFVIALIFGAAAKSAHLQAQDNGPINAGWLEADLKAIASIPNIMPLERLFGWPAIDSARLAARYSLS